MTIIFGPPTLVPAVRGYTFPMPTLLGALTLGLIPILMIRLSHLIMVVAVTTAVAEMMIVIHVRKAVLILAPPVLKVNRLPQPNW